MTTKIAYKANVPYSAANMFALVNDIGSYALFLPYCTRSIVHEQASDKVEASLSVEFDITLPFLGKKKKQALFRTRNFLKTNEQVEMTLVQGPMKYLHGLWTFHDLAAGGSCVALSLEIAFNNKAIGLAFSAVSHQVGERLVNAFVDRARVIYGEPLCFRSP